MPKKKTFKELKLEHDIDEDLRLLEELLQEDMYEQSEARLFYYFQNFWSKFDPAQLVTSWYHECIADHIQAALQRKIRRLIINIPPRSGKSSIGSIMTPTWWWTQKPEEKFWLISHSARLYTQNIVSSRRILEHPDYLNRWCNSEDEDNYKFELSKDVNTKTRIENTCGGYILGGSPTSTTLGIGYTVAILDDILDSEQANSPVAIQTVNDWYTGTFLNRSNDVNNDVIIIIMQRLHENDIVDYVTTKYGDQDWTLLRLPARFDEELAFTNSPIGFNDRRTKPNELLDPIRLPSEFLDTQAKDPTIYNTRYQQNPVNTVTGNTIKREWLILNNERPPVDANLPTLTVWDLSFTDNPESAYSVGGVFQLYNSVVHFVDMWRYRADIPAQLEGIRKMKSRYPNSIVGIEARANGQAAKAMLEKEIPGIIEFDPKLYGGSKEQRLAAVLPAIKDGKLNIYQPLKLDTALESSYDYNQILKELLGFPLAKYDDIVDVLAYAMQYFSINNQTTIGLITKGEKIQLSEEDFYARLETPDPFNIFDGMFNKSQILDLFDDPFNTLS